MKDGEGTEIIDLGTKQRHSLIVLLEIISALRNIDPDAQQLIALLKEQELDRMVYARLYYRTHGHWAEFEIYDCGGFISYEGHVDGRKRSGSFETSLTDELADHEGPWLAGELPPRKEEPEFPCVKYDKKLRGHRANCQFFGHCWPELPQQGVIEL